MIRILISFVLFLEGWVFAMPLFPGSQFLGQIPLVGGFLNAEQSNPATILENHGFSQQEIPVVGGLLQQGLGFLGLGQDPNDQNTGIGLGSLLNINQGLNNPGPNPPDQNGASDLLQPFNVLPPEDEQQVPFWETSKVSTSESHPGKTPKINPTDSQLDLSSLFQSTGLGDLLSLGRGLDFLGQNPGSGSSLIPGLDFLGSNPGPQSSAIPGLDFLGSNPTSGSNVIPGLDFLGTNPGSKSSIIPGLDFLGSLPGSSVNPAAPGNLGTKETESTNAGIFEELLNPGSDSERQRTVNILKHTEFGQLLGKALSEQSGTGTPEDNLRQNGAQLSAALSEFLPLLQDPDEEARTKQLLSLLHDGFTGAFEESLQDNHDLENIAKYFLWVVTGQTDIPLVIPTTESPTTPVPTTTTDIPRSAVLKEARTLLKNLGSAGKALAAGHELAEPLEESFAGDKEIEDYYDLYFDNGDFVAT